MTKPVNFSALMVELYVSDLEASLNFYTNILGFELMYERKSQGFAFLEREGAQIMLEQTMGFAKSTKEELLKGVWRTDELTAPFGRGVNFEIKVNSLDQMLERLSQVGYPLLVPKQQVWYEIQGQRVGVFRFLIQDLDGYLLRFSQAI